MILFNLPIQTGSFKRFSQLLLNIILSMYYVLQRCRKTRQTDVCIYFFNIQMFISSLSSELILCWWICNSYVFQNFKVPRLDPWQCDPVDCWASLHNQTKNCNFAISQISGEWRSWSEWREDRALCKCKHFLTGWPRHFSPGPKRGADWKMSVTMKLLPGCWARPVVFNY